MGSKYRWFDFAGSNPQYPGHPILDEMLAQEKSATSSNKTSAKAKSSSGHKRCSKGNSCGATCIHRDDKCLAEFPPPISSVLTRVSKWLETEVDTGRVSETEAEKVISTLKSETPKSQLDAYKEFGEALKSGKITDTEADQIAHLIVSTTLVPGQDRKAVRAMTYEEIERTLDSNRLEGFEKAYKNSFDEKGVFDPTRPGGMGEYVRNNIEIHQISDYAQSLGFRMLDSKVKTAISKAGSVDEMFGGYDKDGNVIYTDKPTAERGEMLTGKWMRMGGTSPYNGLPIDIRNAEPEHLVANAHAIATGKPGDHPDNLLWEASQPNNNKAGVGDDFSAWRRQLQTWKDWGKEKYDKKIYTPAKVKAEESKGRRESAQTDLEKAMNSISLKEKAEMIKNLHAAYGGDMKYLMRNLGIENQHKDLNVDHRKGGGPGFMDQNIDFLPGTKSKASAAVLVAAMVVDPTKRESMIAEVNKLRRAVRELTPQEAESFRGDNESRLKRKKEKTDQYAQALINVLHKYVPDLNSYL